MDNGLDLDTVIKRLQYLQSIYGNVRVLVQCERENHKGCYDFRTIKEIDSMGLNAQTVVTCIKLEVYG